MARMITVNRPGCVWHGGLLRRRGQKFPGRCGAVPPEHERARVYSTSPHQEPGPRLDSTGRADLGANYRSGRSRSGSSRSGLSFSGYSHYRHSCWPHAACLRSANGPSLRLALLPPGTRPCFQLGRTPAPFPLKAAQFQYRATSPTPSPASCRSCRPSPLPSSIPTTRGVARTGLSLPRSRSAPTTLRCNELWRSPWWQATTVLTRRSAFMCSWRRPPLRPWSH